MSGIEVVGFILAALPLAISAVEHYHNGLDPLRDYLRYDSTLKSLRTRLRIQQDLFEGTLKRLLLDDLSPLQAQALFPDVHQHADTVQWNTPEINKKLQNRLGRKYENFMDVVREMEMAMRKLIKLLDIDVEERPSCNATASTFLVLSLEKGRWEWRKIRRSFGRKQREALIQEFERYNGDIARYVEQREILAPLSQPRPDECSKYYHTVRDNACEVYHALEAGWRCQCSSPHFANLQLECRTSAEASPLFNMFLSFLNQSSQSTTQSTTAQKTWVETQVNKDEIDEQIDINVQHQGSDMIRTDEHSGFIDALRTSAITTGTFSPVMASNANKTRKSVRIMEPNSDSEYPLKQQGPISCIKPSQRAPQIASLCETVRAAQGQPTVLGHLSYTPRKHFTISTLSSSIVAEPVSLDRLLPASNNLPQRREFLGKLSGQQRLRIAVTLAHAVLQLYESPWLSESWSKKDIYFFSHGIDRYRRPVIEHPYVSRFFKPQIPPSLNAVPVKNATDYGESLIINRSLFAFGIILIELCLNKSFEELCAEARHPGGKAPEEPLSTAETYSVATNLVEAVYDEQGTQYGHVVQRCLKCEFGLQDSKKQLDIDAFRALVYEGVLAPLEDDLKRYSLP